MSDKKNDAARRVDRKSKGGGMTMKDRRIEKPEAAKAKKAGGGGEDVVAAAGRTIVALATLCVEMRKVLLMCAPAFPEGSAGARVVAAARNSLPMLREISQKFGGGGK